MLSSRSVINCMCTRVSDGQLDVYNWGVPSSLALHRVVDEPHHCDS